MARLNLDQTYFEKFLQQGGFTLGPKGKTVEELRLSKSKQILVMVDLGRHLSKLHGIKLEKYGPINETEFNQSKRLVGTYSSWYKYLIEFSNQQKKTMDDTLAKEKEVGVVTTRLSNKNRKLMLDILKKRSFLETVLRKNKKMLCGVEPRLLNGNIHPGSRFWVMDLIQIIGRK